MHKAQVLKIEWTDSWINGGEFCYKHEITLINNNGEIFSVKAQTYNDGLMLRYTMEDGRKAGRISLASIKGDNIRKKINVWFRQQLES